MNTFEITIQRSIEKDWRVVVRHQPDSEGMSLWTRGSLNLDLQQLGRFFPTNPNYGLLLGKGLFQDNISFEFRSALKSSIKSQDYLRVLLIVEAEDLQSLHWEQLHAPFETGWDYLLLNQSTPFSRFLPTHIERRFPPIGRRDLRALVVISGPESLEGDYGLSPFNIQDAADRTRKALSDIPCDILADIGDAVGRPTLSEICSRITARHYTIFHLICHGTYLPDTGETILYFPENHEGRPVKGSIFIQNLSRITGLHGLPQFSFLSTCKSANPEAETRLGGFGQRLVRDLGMPAVLAMTDHISFKTADSLASPFYHYLCEHGEVDRAISQALSSLPTRSDITVPALFTRLGNRPLFTEIPQRDLTKEDITFGLEELKKAIHSYSPVLEPEFDENRQAIQALLEVDLQAATGKQKEEYDRALKTVNEMSGEVLDLPFAALAFGKAVPVFNTRCPFQGLFPFRPEDKDFFFGREALIELLQQRLRAHPFLAVLGPSGSGKSSVVLAGLVPQLSLPWTYMTPGTDPAANLHAALMQNKDARLIVIDQFEELFTLVPDEKQKLNFIQRMAELVQNMLVVITMRADFWGECSHYLTLKELIQPNQELIGPMDEYELRSAIEKQAEKVGLRFEADLSQDILDDVRGQPGAMPLLQHALMLLWQRRHGLWLRSEEYRRIGGVQEAIAHTADEFFESLDLRARARVREIFIRLTHLMDSELPGEIRDTRKRVELDSLVPSGSDRGDTLALAHRLADKRLVVISTSRVTSNEEVEVAHEALITHWPLLRKWLQQDREILRLLESVNMAAKEWKKQPDKSMLVHRGGRLEDVIRLSRDGSLILNQDEQNYINNCTALRDQEQVEREAQQRRELEVARKGAQRLRAALMIVVLVAAATVYFWFDASQARDLARQQEKTAIADRAFAEMQSTIADSERSVAKTQASIADGERSTARTQAAIAENERTTAQIQSRLAISRQLANQAAAYRSINPQLAMLLAIEAVNTTFLSDHTITLEADAVLREILYDGYQGIVMANENAPVNSVTISPDGIYLLTLQQDGRSLVWNTTTGNQLFTVDSQARITATAFSPDSTQLAAIDINGEIGIYDAATGNHVNWLGQHQDAYQVAFSLDGRALATASSGTIRKWDFENPQRFKELQVDDLSVRKLIFGPQSELLMITTADAVVWLPEEDQENVRFQLEGGVPIKVATVDKEWNSALLVPASGIPLEWNLAEPASSRRLPFYEDQIAAAAYSSSGLRFVTISDDGTTKLWNGRDHAIITTLMNKNYLQSGPYLVEFTPDGNRLVLAREEGQAIVWDAANGVRVGELTGFNGRLSHAVFAMGSSKITAVDSAGEVWVWESVKEPDHVEMNGLTKGAWRVVIDPTNRFVAAAGEEGVVQVWRIASGEPVATMLGHEKLGDTTAGINSLAFSPDGEKVITAGWDHTARIWETQTGRELLMFSGHTGMLLDVLFDNTGKFAISCSTDGTLKVWDASSGQEFMSWFINEPINRLVIDSSGTLVAGSGGNLNSYLWNLQSKQQLILPSDGSLVAIQFSPDSSRIAAAGFNGNGYIWDASTGEKLIELSGLEEEDTYALDFSPDGQLLATGGDEGIVKVFNTTSGIRTMTLRGHNSRIWSAAFHPDGIRLATGSEDGTIRIWNVETGETEAILPGVVGEESFTISGLYDKSGSESFTAGSDSISVGVNNEGITTISATADLKLPWVSWIVFNEGGSRLISAAMNGQVDMYITDMNELVKLAKLRAGREPTCRERVLFLSEELTCSPIPPP